MRALQMCISRGCHGGGNPRAALSLHSVILPKNKNRTGKVLKYTSHVATLQNSKSMDKHIASMITPCMNNDLLTLGIKVRRH